MTLFFPRMWDGIEACEPQGSGGGGGGWRAASKLFYRGSCSPTGMESLLAGAQENLLHNVNNKLSGMRFWDTQVPMRQDLES